jgi:hypothetical protein
MARKRGMLGKVDLLGLSDFGGGISPLTGALIGGGVSFVGSLAAAHTSQAKHRELIGLGLGLATAGTFYAMKSTRHAAAGVAFGALIAAGLRWVEGLLFGGKAAAGVSGMGIPQIRDLNGGLGMPQIRSLSGVSLGVPSINQVRPPVGTIPGVAGNQVGMAGHLSGPPVSLLGNPGPMAAQLLGMGGPQVHGLSASYGATLLGGGR